MTFAGIDVTGSVARALHERLWRAARLEIDATVPVLGDLRAPAETAWWRLHTPIQVGEGLWLALNPTAVWVSQPVADGRTLDLVVGLSARPRLSETVPAALVSVPALPALRTAPPAAAGIELPMRLVVGHEDAERLLRSHLEGKPLQWAGREVTPQRVLLAAGGGALTVELSLSGAVAGTVRLTGTPDYNRETGELYLRDLDYALSTGDPGVERLERGLHDLLRAVVEARARWPLRDRIAEWRERVEQSLGGLLPPPFTLRTRLTGARPTAVSVTDSATVLEGVLEGRAHLTVD
jgi:hypothetical protein